jgi:hypothetical protein
MSAGETCARCGREFEDGDVIRVGDEEYVQITFPPALEAELPPAPELELPVGGQPVHAGSCFFPERVNWTDEPD